MNPGRLRTATAARLRHSSLWRQYRKRKYRRLERTFASRRLLDEFAATHPRPFFVEVGANDGKKHDHLHRLIESHGWRGVMVEPVPFVFRRLEDNYANVDGIALENVAIADRDGELPFYHLSEASQAERAQLPDWYDGIGSFSRDAVLGHARDIPDIADRLKVTTVPALTFQSLLSRHAVDRVDLLLIDTEGYDWEVLRTIDVTSCRPRVMVYEHYHLSPGDRAACRTHLEAAGYATLEEGFDTFCVDTRVEDRLTRMFGELRPAVAGVSVHDEPDRGAHAQAGRLDDLKLYDDSVPLPPGAAEQLRDDNPRLQELRRAYERLDLPVGVHSRWNERQVQGFLDLRWFRGETLITWHYREEPRVTALKYLAYLRELEAHGGRELVERLAEDGLFGCWTYSFPERPTVSRDLLDSVNEILFLERHMSLSERDRLAVLDVGAGYGRLAHRMSQALPNLGDYCCVDAIPESTFLCEYYLGFRGCEPPARVVPLHEVSTSLIPGTFDLAVNVHSFSECPLAAVAWWVDLLADLGVPRLLIVPNDGVELLSLEADGSRRDFAPTLERAGYRLLAREPVVADQAVRELVPLEDHFHLFARP